MTMGITVGQTLLGEVQRTFATEGDRPALTFLVDGEPEGADTCSFAELDRAARAVAADLQMTGVRPGDRVMLCHTPGRHMIVGFLGCIYAGAIAVPAYPPSPFMGTRGKERLLGMLNDASATAVLTTSHLVPLLQFPEEEYAAWSWVFTDKSASSIDAYAPVDVIPEDVAFLQYTSGSTSDPRGVRVTHGALMANIQMILEVCQLNKNTVACSWLPPFHDMGLIATILAPLVGGFPTVQMSPEAFLRRPERWLKAITHYRADFAWAPNFAYDMCVRRIHDLDGIDLSGWTVAGNGSEPIKEQTFVEFARKFADCGFRPRSLWAGYGLAEAVLLVATRQRGPGSTMWVDPEQLSQGRFVPAATALGQPLISCGPPARGTTVTIRDPATGERVDDGIVGEIWVSGPQVCDGYWQRPALSADIFPDGTLRSGDLGVLWQGELYVTGRLKDLLIIRGRNHYPQDIEQTMEAADPTLLPHGGVAVSVPTDSEELVVLIQEVEANSKGDPKLIVEKIRRLVIEEHGITADAIVLIRRGTIPKTTSGKLRRSSAAEAFRTGKLRVVHQWPDKPDKLDG